MLHRAVQTVAREGPTAHLHQNSVRTVLGSVGLQPILAHQSLRHALGTVRQKLAGFHQFRVARLGKVGEWCAGTQFLPARGQVVVKQDVLRYRAEVAKRRGEVASKRADFRVGVGELIDGPMQTNAVGQFWGIGRPVASLDAVGHEVAHTHQPSTGGEVQVG